MKTKARQTSISDSYLSLIFEFPLRPIRSHTQYELATKIMERLAVRDEGQLDAGERDYLDALDEFVMLYDQKHFSFPVEKRTPLERLKYLLAESGTSPAQLKALLQCSQPLVSMILKGDRELTKDHIKTLASHFKLNPAYLL